MDLSSIKNDTVLFLKMKIFIDNQIDHPETIFDK